MNYLRRVIVATCFNESTKGRPLRLVPGSKLSNISEIEIPPYKLLLMCTCGKYNYRPVSFVPVSRVDRHQLNLTRTTNSILFRHNLIYTFRYHIFFQNIPIMTSAKNFILALGLAAARLSAAAPLNTDSAGI